MAVDKIVLKSGESYTVDKWKALPLPTRIGYISRNEARFYASGQEVSAKVAVAELR